jgi:hypothetical protein
MPTKNNESAEFSTSDLEISAAIFAVTHRRPSVFRDSLSGYGVFVHQYDDAVQNTINAYSAGSLLINARAILMARRGLFRDLKALPRDGGRR